MRKRNTTRQQSQKIENSLHREIQKEFFEKMGCGRMLKESPFSSPLLYFPLLSSPLLSSPLSPPFSPLLPCPSLTPTLWSAGVILQASQAGPPLGRLPATWAVGGSSIALQLSAANAGDLHTDEVQKRKPKASAWSGLLRKLVSVTEIWVHDIPTSHPGYKQYSSVFRAGTPAKM